MDLKKAKKLTRLEVVVEIDKSSLSMLKQFKIIKITEREGVFHQGKLVGNYIRVIELNNGV